MHSHVHIIGSRIDSLLASLWQAGGTDLLLTVGMPPMLRVDGSLTPAPGTTALSADDTDSLLTGKTTTGVAGAGSNTYSYDGLGRLTTWTNPAAQTTTYGYDGASNRTTVTTAAGVRTTSRPRLEAGVSGGGSGP